MTTDRDGSRLAAFDDKLSASIRKVLRGHGVPDRELDDKCQAVRLKAAQASGLPKTEPERTQYIHGIARNVGRKYRAERPERRDATPFDEEAAPPAEVVSYESVDLARRLHAEAVARDPQGTDWLVRAKVYGENETGIARRDGVPVDRVRQRIKRLVAKMRANSDSLTMLASLLLLATFMGRWALHERPLDGSPPDKAMSAAPSQEPAPQEPTAEQLRRAAFAACDARRWNECVEDFDKARTIDPVGDTAADVQTARRAAAAAVRERLSPDVK